MLEISLRDRVPNAEIRRRMRVDDVFEQITELNCNWTVHIA